MKGFQNAFIFKIYSQVVPEILEFQCSKGFWISTLEWHRKQDF